MTDGRKTPLYPFYKEEGVKMVNFGGWQMPVQFSSIKAEHQAVREKAGLFDVSHMGEAIVSGKGALSLLQRVATNDVSKLKPGKAQYTLMCTHDGGTIDDLIIYQLAEERYMLVLNAANIDKDLQWLHQQNHSEAAIENKSDEIALLAVQGPEAEGIVQKLAKEDLSEIGFFSFRQEVNLASVKTLVSRTGYTGEDGFELYCPAEKAIDLWKALLSHGKEEGLVPCGLGARDTLRFEARLPLYGQELTEDISPLEAGLSFAVKVNKPVTFVGRDALKKEKEEGMKRKLVGLEMIDKGIPRSNYDVYSENGEWIGHVTSGTQSPTLKKNVGLALLSKGYTDLETTVVVQVRKRKLRAKVVKTPFYQRSKS